MSFAPTGGIGAWAIGVAESLGLADSDVIEDGVAYLESILSGSETEEEIEDLLYSVMSGLERPEESAKEGLDPGKEAQDIEWRQAGIGLAMEEEEESERGF